jgi:hypothetical protein
VQSAPLWLMKPTLPGRAMAPAKVAFSPRRGFIRPRQFGPNQPHVAASRLCKDLPLQLGAGRTSLFGSRRDDDGPLDAHVGALTDDARDHRRRRDDDSEIRGLG